MTAEPDTTRLRRLAPLAAVVLTYWVAAVLVFSTTNPLDGWHLPGGGVGDGALESWFLNWVPYAIAHGLNPFRSTFIDYPSGIDVANQTSVPLLGLVTWPLAAVAGPIATFNFLLRAAFALSAIAMYGVLRAWRVHRVAAFVGGLVYGFSPYMVRQVGVAAHLHLAFVPLLPLLVYLSHELVVVQRRRAVVLGAVLGLCAAAQAYISPELLVDLAIVLAGGLVVLAAVRYRDVAARARYALLGGGVAVLVFLVLAGAEIWWALFAAGHVVGSAQPTWALQHYRADLLGPVVPTSSQALAPSGLTSISSAFDNFDPVESGAYLGVPLIGCLVATLVVLRREARVWLVAGLMAFAFVLSLGSRLSIDNHVYQVPLFGAILRRLPLTDNIVPARFAVDVVLFAAVLLAFGVDRLVRAAAWRRPAVGIATVVAMLATVATLAPSQIAEDAFRWPPSITATLEAVPAGTVVLTYPYPKAAAADAMVWQEDAGFRFKLVGGYAMVQGSPTNGVLSPLLGYPPYPQELLAAAENPYYDFYPIPAVPYPGRNLQLCEFLGEYDVGAVVYWGGGDNPAIARTYFHGALGDPTRAQDGVEVWLRPLDRCF